MNLVSILGLLSLTAKSEAQTIVNFEDGTVSDPALGFNVGTVGGATDFLQIVNGYTDPGNWSIEGSNGPKFLGFWGDWGPGTGGYSGGGDTVYSHIYFTAPDSSTPQTVDVSFDVLISTGSYPGNSFTFYGFQGGSQVASDNLTFSPVTIDGYPEYLATVNFTGVDEIRFENNEPGGLDNFSYSTLIGVPEPSTLAVAGLGGLISLLFCRRKNLIGKSAHQIRVAAEISQTPVALNGCRRGS